MGPGFGARLSRVKILAWLLTAKKDVAYSPVLSVSQFP